MANVFVMFTQMSIIDKVMFVVWSISLVGMALSLSALVIKILFNPKFL